MKFIILAAAIFASAAAYCDTNGAQNLLANLPNALTCGHPGDHEFESDLGYVVCTFLNLEISSAADAVQKAAAIGIDLITLTGAEEPTAADMAAKAPQIFAAVLGFACGCGADLPVCSMG